MSSLNIPLRNPKCCWRIASSFDRVVDRFRSYAPKTKSNFMFFLALTLSLSLSFSALQYFVKLNYKIICVITWKTNIEWRKPFIYEIKSGKVLEVEKGSGTKSLNFLHLWLKLVIDKKIGWCECLNEILFIQHATWQNLILSYMSFLLLYKEALSEVEDWQCWNRYLGQDCGSISSYQL